MYEGEGATFTMALIVFVRAVVCDLWRMGCNLASEDVAGAMLLRRWTPQSIGGDSVARHRCYS